MRRIEFLMRVSLHRLTRRGETHLLRSPALWQRRGPLRRLHCGSEGKPYRIHVSLRHCHQSLHQHRKLAEADAAREMAAEAWGPSTTIIRTAVTCCRVGNGAPTCKQCGTSRHTTMAEHLLCRGVHRRRVAVRQQSAVHHSVRHFRRHHLQHPPCAAAPAPAPSPRAPAHPSTADSRGAPTALACCRIALPPGSANGVTSRLLALLRANCAMVID